MTTAAKRSGFERMCLRKQRRWTQWHNAPAITGHERLTMTTQASGQSVPSSLPCSTSSPDRGRLPDSVSDLNWQEHRPGTGYYDNDILLAAVPVNGSTGWAYELAVISAVFNGDYLDWYCNGELWEWAIDDAEFVVRI